MKNKPRRRKIVVSSSLVRRLVLLDCQGNRTSWRETSPVFYGNHPPSGTAYSRRLNLSQSYLEESASIFTSGTKKFNLMNEENLDSTPCSLRDALEKVRFSLRGVAAHANKNGCPAEVVIAEPWIEACTRPFPLTEGNEAETMIDFFTVEQDLAGRKVTRSKNPMTGATTIRLDAKNK